MIKRGDTVQIKPEYQDEGDAGFVWIALDDESKGRITLQSQVTDTLVKTEIFQVFMLVNVNP